MKNYWPGINMKHQVNFKKWKVLSIPVRDLEQYIPFAHIEPEEMAWIIHEHKRWTTTDPVELSIQVMCGETELINQDVMDWIKLDGQIQGRYAYDRDHGKV